MAQLEVQPAHLRMATAVGMMPVLPMPPMLPVPQAFHLVLLAMDSLLQLHLQLLLLEPQPPEEIQAMDSLSPLPCQVLEQELPVEAQTTANLNLFLLPDFLFPTLVPVTQVNLNQVLLLVRDKALLPLWAPAMADKAFLGP